jgi:hypothetical protein
MYFRLVTGPGLLLDPLANGSSDVMICSLAAFPGWSLQRLGAFALKARCGRLYFKRQGSWG